MEEFNSDFILGGDEVDHLFDDEYTGVDDIDSIRIREYFS